MGLVWRYHLLLLLLVSKSILGENFHLMKFSGQRLEVTYNTMEALSAIHCNALCRSDRHCHSVNYNEKTCQCQHSEICHTDVSGNTAADPDWEVYTLNDQRNCGCVYNNEADDYYVGSANIEIISTPGSVQSNSECAWFIKAPSGYHVTLTFSSITLEDTLRCHRESVKIYDGDSHNDPLLGVFCGNSLAGPIRSCKVEKLYIRFQTDNTAEHIGFKATWNFQAAIPCGCSYHNIDAGTITSPNYPNDYTANADCVWLLTANTGIFTLQRTEFDLENSLFCGHDYLEVRDGVDENARLLEKVCANAIFTPYSTRPSMYIRFVTDNSREYRGFRLEWTVDTGILYIGR